MPQEIERKFLVTDTSATAPWRAGRGVAFCQGYLNRDKRRTVRVRIADGAAFLTVKGESVGAVRAEFEYAIPVADAQALLGLCDGPLITKTRFSVAHHGMTWEVDVFEGDNAGLVVAEVELVAQDQPLDLPGWVGTEVTQDARYFNSNLATHPFVQW